MAKISQSQLDRIKRELKIKELAEEQGLQLVRKNGQFVTRCLWHSDKTPSLFIHPTKNLFNCFGCDAGGDVIQWVMKSFKMEFARAIEYILNRYPHLKEEETVSPEKVKTETCPLTMDCSDQKFIQQVIEFYHQRLLNDYAAQDYLQKRGILDNEAIKTHKIGFADRDLGRAIPNAQRKAGKEIRGKRGHPNFFLAFAWLAATIATDRSTFFCFAGASDGQAGTWRVPQPPRSPDRALRPTLCPTGFSVRSRQKHRR